MREQIRSVDAGVDETLAMLYASVRDARALAQSATGVLVFPRVAGSGPVAGADPGQGALVVRDRVRQHYRITGAPAGLQDGNQSRALVLMFLTTRALARLRSGVDGWTAGVDAPVAVASGGLDTGVEALSGQADVVAFALTNAGLMAGVTLDGVKITPRPGLAGAAGAPSLVGRRAPSRSPLPHGVQQQRGGQRAHAREIVGDQ